MTEVFDFSNHQIIDILVKGPNGKDYVLCQANGDTVAKFNSARARCARYQDGGMSGLSRDRVVKHYSPPAVLPEENSGLMPSVLAGKDAVKEALSKGTRFLMETDFLDDPGRPGAVMAITTVPKRTMDFIEKGLMTEDQAHVIHSENPRRTYGPAFE